MTMFPRRNPRDEPFPSSDRNDDELFVGTCPKCEAELELQENKVVCKFCGYSEENQSAEEKLDKQLVEEKQKTHQCLNDILQELSHAFEHTATRGELLKILKDRIASIEDDIKLDRQHLTDSRGVYLYNKAIEETTS